MNSTITIEVAQFRYADHWPIWCVIKNGKVLCCRKTESEAIDEMESMEGVS